MTDAICWTARIALRPERVYGFECELCMFLVSCEEPCQGVEGMLHYNAREKQSLCGGSSVDRLETRARCQDTVY